MIFLGGWFFLEYTFWEGIRFSAMRFLGVCGFGGGGGTPCPPPTPHPKKKFFDPPPKHTLKVASGSHFEPLFEPRRPRTLLNGFSGDFLHKVSVSKNCQGGQKHTSMHTLRTQNSDICTFPDIYRGNIQQFLKTGPFWNGMGQLVYECMCIFPR